MGETVDNANTEPAKKQELAEAAEKLLSAICGAQDTLTETVPLDMEEAKDLQKINDELFSFFESNMKLVSAAPRKLSENDKTKMLPGQHSGIMLEFSNATGDRLIVNVYGGLRVFSSSDMRDFDTSLRNIHDRRTDVVVSQPTYINWHIVDIRQKKVCESWIKKTQPVISLYKASWEGKSVDAVATVNSESSVFNKMSQELSTNINSLTKIIPSVNN